MPNPMTQDQLVDICRLMDINKDGLVDLNEFLESFRLAEKSLQDEEDDYQATWQELDRRPSRTAVDKDETGVEIEILKMDEGGKNKQRDKNGQAHLMGDCVASFSKDPDEIKLIDCEDTPKRLGLLESDIWIWHCLYSTESRYVCILSSSLYDSSVVRIDLCKLLCKLSKFFILYSLLQTLLMS